MAKDFKTIDSCFKRIINTKLNPYSSITCKILLLLRLEAIKNCKEYQELRQIYQEIKSAILKIKDQYGFKHVEEIFAYFVFLINNNYLYYDAQANITHNLQKIPAEKSILAALTLNHHGCCRHKAHALADIYTDSAIAASVVPGYLASAADQDTIEFAQSLGLPGILKGSGHAVTIVNEGGKTYLLDPEFDEFYIKKGDNVYMSNNQNRFIKYSKKLTRDYYKIASYYKPIPTLDEDLDAKRINALIDESLKTILNNIDLVNTFYHDIQDKLGAAEETYQRILRNL